MHSLKTPLFCRHDEAKGKKKEKTKCCCSHDKRHQKQQNTHTWRHQISIKRLRRKKRAHTHCFLPQSIDRGSKSRNLCSFPETHYTSKTSPLPLILQMRSPQKSSFLDLPFFLSLLLPLHAPSLHTRRRLAGGGINF